MGDMQGAKRETEKLKLQAEKYGGKSGYWRLFLSILAQAYSVTGDFTEAERALREVIRLAWEELEQRREHRASTARAIGELYSKLSAVLSEAKNGEA